MWVVLFPTPGEVESGVHPKSDGREEEPDRGIPAIAFKEQHYEDEVPDGRPTSEQFTSCVGG